MPLMIGWVVSQRMYVVSQCMYVVSQRMCVVCSGGGNGRSFSLKLDGQCRRTLSDTASSQHTGFIIRDHCRANDHHMLRMCAQGMIAEALPEFLRPVLDRLRRVSIPRLGPTGTGNHGSDSRRQLFGGADPNQCLLNRYEGAHGIGAHMDGPLYEPSVAILSLLSSAVIHFTPTTAATSRGFSILLTAGSLLVFEEACYTAAVHHIDDCAPGEPETVPASCVNTHLTGVPCGAVVDRGRRLSLTLRTAAPVAVDVGAFWSEEMKMEMTRRRAWWATAVSERPS